MKTGKIVRLTCAATLIASGMASCVSMKTYRQTQQRALRCEYNSEALLSEMEQLREQRAALEAQFDAEGMTNDELRALLQERTRALDEVRDLLGEASLAARVDGMIGRGIADANIVGDVSDLSFNGYVYDSLRLAGRLRNREFDGLITVRDPNLGFNFFGKVDLNDSVPRYDFTLDLKHADLTKLRMTGIGKQVAENRSQYRNGGEYRGKHKIMLSGGKTRIKSVNGEDHNNSDKERNSNVINCMNAEIKP